MISMHEVSKNYGSMCALDRVTLEVGRDDGIVALLGRNGAGKSTLMSVLAGLAMESSGVLALDDATLGAERRALRRATTILPQDLQYEPKASARGFVRHLLCLRGMDPDRADPVFAAFELDAILGRPLRTLSGGQRQRVGLAYALATTAQTLLLDEPTQGLDPWERLRLADCLAGEAASRLVLCATHIVSDVEATASRVIVLDQGRVVFNGTPDELRQTAPPMHLVDCDLATFGELRTRGVVTSVARTAPDRFRIRLQTDRPPVRAKPVEPTLTDSYLLLTRPSV